MIQQPVISTIFGTGYVSVEVEQAPNVDADYEAIIGGEEVPEVVVRFERMPDFDADPDCDAAPPGGFGLDPGSEQTLAFGLDPAAAVALANQLIELATPFLNM
jgi:hypothetical protein